jgi:hypothetical protein
MHNDTSTRTCVHGKPLSAPCGACLLEASMPGGRITKEKLTASPEQPVAPSPQVFDTVLRPSHYNQSDDIECIDAMVAAFGQEAVREHCRITAFKYLWRYNHKGRAKEDIDKAIWYLRFSQGDDPRAYRK